MKRNLLAAVALAALVFSSCSNSTGGGAGSGDAVDLKLNLEKGKTYSYAMQTHFDMMAEGKNISGGDMDMSYKMAVDDVDGAGLRSLSTTYDALKFRVNAMGMEMGYDSKNIGDTTKENMMNKMFRQMFGGMLGKTFKLKMSPKGEVSEISGTKELIDGMVNGMNIPEQAKSQVRTQMEQSFSEKQVQQSFAQGFSIFPDKPIKKGDSWTKVMNQNLNNLDSKAEATYTVKDITADQVILDVTGKISNGESAQKMEMNGTQTGTMKVSRNTGLVQDGKINIDMKVKDPSMPKPMDMKMTVSIASN